MCVIFFFFNDTATTEIYTLSLHDALPIFGVHDDVDLVRAEAEEPVRLDDFEPLVHQGRRVDGYLRAHVPGRVAHRLLDGRRRHRAQRLLAERPARRGQNQTADFLAPLAAQTLVERVVLGVDGE